MSDRLELRIPGSISPEKFSISKLIEIAKSIEGALIPVIKKNNPGIKESDIIVSLVAITEGSVGFAFVPGLTSGPLKSDKKSTFEVYKAVRSGDLSGLPEKSREFLQEIPKFLKRNKHNLEFGPKEEPIAMLTPETKFTLPERKTVDGQTTVYGRVERIGGATTPKVSLRLLDGELLNCKLSEELAIQIGKRLYSYVGLLGKATWDVETKEILSFEVTGLTNFEESTLSESFKELSSSLGSYYLDVNAEEFLKDLRG